MKFLFAALTLMITCIANSQVRLNLFAGPLATTVKYRVEGEKQEQSMKAGFQVGAGLKIPFENKLYFSPALQYGYKGYKVTLAKSSSLPEYAAIDNNTAFHTAELSFLLQYDLGADRNTWYIKAGPALDFPLFGKEKYNTNSGGAVDRSMKYSYNDYGHYLVNLSAYLGYESSSGFFVHAHYDHGVTNISNRDGGPVILNRAFGITIGKFLNSKIFVERDRM